MPLKLVPPRPGKTPNYYVRGSYLGVAVDRTTGTPDRTAARKALAKIKSDIERGSFTPKGALTFAGAALSYLRSGGEDRFIGPLSDHFGVTPVSDIDQAAIDEAADRLYPKASSATRNRQVYTPVSAILKHANVDFAVKRPKGAQGEVRVAWLWEDDAFRLLEEAGKVDPEFRIFLATLLYTGLRLSEALRLRVDWLSLPESFAFIPKTKNSEPRALYLPPVLVAELAMHETDFHTFRHTWATWMRRYGKLDTKGLMATQAWKDEKSAARYQHVVVTEEMTRADLLPAPKRGKSVERG
jgi:integrase